MGAFEGSRSSTSVATAATIGGFSSLLIPLATSSTASISNDADSSNRCNANGVNCVGGDNGVDSSSCAAKTTISIRFEPVISRQMGTLWNGAAQKMHVVGIEDANSSECRIVFVDFDHTQ